MRRGCSRHLLQLKWLRQVLLPPCTSRAAALTPLQRRSQLHSRTPEPLPPLPPPPITTNRRPMGLLAVPLDAVPLLLSWPAVLEGWYLQGSALLSRRVAERQVPPGRGFKTSQVERVRRQRLRLEPEEDAESDPAFAQFLRRMEVKEEDEGDEEQRGLDTAADEL